MVTITTCLALRHRLGLGLRLGPIFSTLIYKNLGFGEVSRWSEWVLAGLVLVAGLGAC